MTEISYQKMDAPQHVKLRQVMFVTFQFLHQIASSNAKFRTVKNVLALTRLLIKEFVQSVSRVISFHRIFVLFVETECLIQENSAMMEISKTMMGALQNVK